MNAVNLPRPEWMSEDLVLLHEPDGQTQLGSAQRTGITPAASAEDDEIECISAPSVGCASRAIERTGHGAILSVAEDPRLCNIAAIIGA